MGYLPFRILELTQRVREEFRLWRVAPNDQVREWIQARIINDAGLLGHYVADGSNPAHTSVNFNGWTGPNPNGYATDRRFHSRFESAYVETHIKIDDVLPGVDSNAVAVGGLRPAIVAYLRTTNGEIEHLYQLDKAAPFDANTTAPDNKQFTAARLAAGAQMLRNLWWTAWVTSAPGVRGQVRQVRQVRQVTEWRFEPDGRTHRRARQSSDHPQFTRGSLAPPAAHFAKICDMSRNALNSRAFPLGSRTNMVACSPGSPANRM